LRNGGVLTLWASFLTDGLGDLLEGVAALVRGPEQATATVRWMDEPGEHRWQLTRDGDGVRVRILAWLTERLLARAYASG
jgi:hypothetical protein